MQRNISPVNMICLLLMAVLMLTGIRAEAGHLEEIAARGTIRIGTTGDYIPMSYLNPQTGEYEGIDAELSKIIADSLGVKIQYVPTTWPTLAADTQAGKFDIALCGISRNYNRAKTMAMSDAYGEGLFGKTILCRFLEYDIEAGEYTIENIYSSSIVDKMLVKYIHRSRRYQASFTEGKMVGKYKSSVVPQGWIKPLDYIRLTRNSGRIAKIRIIVPHSSGTANASGYVLPMYYEISYQLGI